MAQTSLPWGGTVTGDAGPYTDDQWSDTWRQLFTRDSTLEGVLPNYLSELVVTNPAAATIRVGTGSAVVDGKFYRNTAVVDLAGAVPGGGANYYTVVIQKTWATQQVRAVLIGPDAGAPPAVTQSDGLTWEIAIATVQITSGGVVTITDARVYAHYNTNISTAMLEDASVTAVKIPDNSIPSAKLIDGAGSGVDADLLDGLDGTSYLNNVTALTGASDISLNDTPTLIPGLTTNLTTGNYLITGIAVLEGAGTTGQWGEVKTHLYRAGVIVQGEPRHHIIITAGGISRVTISYTWYISISGTQTVELRARLIAGFTLASVDTNFGYCKLYCLKI